ncbi:MAG: membrane protein insertion efficiency factor YidD [Micrococcales bacterium]
MIRTALVNLLLVPRNLMIGFVLLWRKFISPIYGDVCRYVPTCSDYGLQQFQQRGLLIGGILTFWRILRCNPWSHGGSDPVTLAPLGAKYFSVTTSGFTVASKKGKI